MTLLIGVVVLLAITLLYTLSIRAKDIPKAEPVSPTQHLDERKAAIYENLRDLQFEYRVGKLSDADYQQTKLSLQRELAAVLAEIQRVSNGSGPAEKSAASADQTAARVESAALAAAQTAPRHSPVAGESQAAVAAPTGTSGTAVSADTGVVCGHCGAQFPAPMKFCGQCGKEMR